MAERRMFAKTIIDSDIFLEMPLSTQALYFHLSMRADDDGFINNPKRIMRMIGCAEDDLKILIAKQFIIPFESGLVVIKHWKIHNYIQKDRYRPSSCEEKDLISLDKGSVYILDTECIQDGYKMDTQDRLGKDRLGKDRLGKDRLGKDRLELGKDRLELGKDSIGEVNADTPCQVADAPPSKNSKSSNKRFIKPTLEEIKAYCKERNNNVNAEKWLDYYEANGFKVGKNSMKDWKASVRTWEKNNYNNSPNVNTTVNYNAGIEGVDYL